jgi:hypothetical protein
VRVLGPLVHEASMVAVEEPPLRVLFPEVLSYRFPDRLGRCRLVSPDDTAMGAVPV